MTSGIYCYYDDVKHRVIYIGKDSYIDENRRHKQHYYPSLKKEQTINSVLQNDLENNNINRYTYVVLERSDDWTNDDLNEKEKYWISLFKPKFNLTEGGDGADSGENHPLYGKTGTDHPKWKNYARVVKYGFTSSGKQRYALRYNGENRTYDINKEELEKLAGRINKLENKDEEIIKQIIEEYNKKNYARVIKAGITQNGKQNYTLICNGEYRIYGTNKEELEEIADRINKLENKDEEIINQIIEEYKARKKNHARVIKQGFNNGKQNYALMQNGKIIKRSIDKEKLEKLAEEINAKKNKGV